MNNEKEKKLSPMMTHYLSLKQSYPDCIVFYRLGDFYEMFYDDAKTASKELDLTLTTKSCGLEEKAPMCGVPFHAYENYAKKLVEKGYRVAICEQIGTGVGASKLFERDVVKVITAGTITENSMLDESKNNYILCIYESNNAIYYSYGDISTGEFKCGTIDENIHNRLNDLIMKLTPAEIICNTSAYDKYSKLPCTIASDKYKLKKYYDWAFQSNAATNLIINQYHLSSLGKYDFAESIGNICVVGALLQFFVDTQKNSLKHIAIPTIEHSNDYMYLDSTTRRNLELEENSNDKSKRNSLLWVLDDTHTSLGKRMLKAWMRSPLQKVQDISSRQDKVKSLVSAPILRQIIDLELDKVADIERIGSRISCNTVNPRELTALSITLRTVTVIKKNLSQSATFKNICDQLIDLSDVSDYIDKTINIDAPINIKDGGVIKAGVNEALDKYRSIKLNAVRFVTDLEQRERESTGIKNLKIAFNRVAGYYIEVNKQYLDKVPFSYIRKQTVANNERYITEELKQFEEDFLTSDENAIKLEVSIYNSIKEYLSTHLEQFKLIGHLLATIDCLNSFAKTAVNNHYSCPIMDNSKDIDIRNGRHPVVEHNMDKNLFVGNHCLLDQNANQILIITGPNMAGKSTYMRQNAIITLMAHLGSFVPADSARIGIVDRIFTRIGASDDLSQGQSTFMVEMVEVANILSACTKNSLVLLDEVGRGTSTYDGLSIAWAVVEYLAEHTDTKTIFATHYHELTELEGKLDSVKNYRFSLKEMGGEIVFLRKIERGGAMRSYGIEVASLAGLPKTLIASAKNILVDLEKKDIAQPGNIKTLNPKIGEILRQLDLDNMTPMKAMETLEFLHSINTWGE